MKRFSSLLAGILACSVMFASSPAKSVSILGDSYSTFEGFLEPSSNAIWYFADPQRDLTDVDDVEQTWWHLFITGGGYKLEKNNSFSGSTVCNTGYGGADYTDRSFISRMDNLGCPDIILIFGATNDSWANAPLGEMNYENPAKGDLYSFRPALCHMLSHMVKRYPGTQIVYLLNDGLKPEINESITEACNHYGVPCLPLEGISKTAGHPDREGMKQIAAQLKTFMDNR